MPLDLAWNFTDPPGSQRFHESHGDPANDLYVGPGYGAVSASGNSVGFHDDSVLITSGNVFNPGNAQNIVMCIQLLDYDTDYDNNVLQIGHSSPGCVYSCMLKVTGRYGKVIAPAAGFQVKTHGTVHDLKWHWITFTRHGNVWSVYWDGQLRTQVTSTAITDVPLTKRVEVGGKFNVDGQTNASDSLHGVVGFVGLGKS